MSRNSQTPGVLVSGDRGTFAYTPAITWVGNTLSSVTAQVVILPGVVIIFGAFGVSTSVSGTLTIPLPSTLTVPAGAVIGNAVLANTVGTFNAVSTMTAPSSSAVWTAISPLGATGFNFQIVLPGIV